MWPSKDQREDALKKITSAMNFDLKAMHDRDMLLRRVKVIYI